MNVTWIDEEVKKTELMWKRIKDEQVAASVSQWKQCSGFLLSASFVGLIDT